MFFSRIVFFVLLFALCCVANSADNFSVIQRLPKPDVKLTQSDVRVLVILVEFAGIYYLRQGGRAFIPCACIQLHGARPVRE